MIDAFFETFRLLCECAHADAEEGVIRFNIGRENEGKWCQRCGYVFVGGRWHAPSVLAVLHARKSILLGAVQDLADALGAGSEAATELEEALLAVGRVAGNLSADASADLVRLASGIKFVADAAGIWFDEGGRLCRRLGVQCTIKAVGTEGRARALAPLVDGADTDPPEAPASEPSAPASSDEGDGCEVLSFPSMPVLAG